MKLITAYRYSEDSSKRDVALGITIINYSADGVSTIAVGVPLPRGTQTMDDIAKQFAPLNLWFNELNPVNVTAEPAAGNVVFAPSVTTGTPVNQPTTTGTKPL